MTEVFGMCERVKKSFNGMFNSPCVYVAYYRCEICKEKQCVMHRCKHHEILRGHKYD